jgi:hypothetical protein
MNLLLGRHLLGRHILAGKAGSAVVIIDYPSPPLVDNTFVIDLYDAQGQRVAQIGSDILSSPICSLEFELVSTGCGAFKLTLDRQFNQEISYNQRMDIRLFGDRQPWYSGYVQKRPQPGSTDMTLEYSGYGFFQQLDRIVVNKTYENIEIASIVHDLMASMIEPETDIVYNASKIYSTGYTAEKLAFDYVKAKEAIKTLAEFATNYVYGVDEYRELYFKPLRTEINEDSRFWVGYHVLNFRPEEDTDDIINFFYVKGGKMGDTGSNIYTDGNGNPVAFKDEQSINTYGMRQDVLSIPSALGGADIVRWAQNELAKRKEPKRSAKVDKFIPDIVKRKIKPEGMARITTEDGRHSYEYPIKSVKYKIDSGGIQFSMQLGEYTNRLDKYIVKLYRDMKNAELAQQLNNQQLKGGTV